MQFIDLAAQYQHLKTRIDKRIQDVLDHGQYIMGPEVQELEEKLAEYVGVKHAITCANGTDALTLALMALEIGEGDAVLVPTFTFFASAEAVVYAKATPIFVDSDEATFNICPIDLEKRIQSEDRAHRIGQKNNVTYIDLISEKTVDENIVSSLRNKIDLASQSLGEKLKSWLIEGKKKKGA